MQICQPKRLRINGKKKDYNFDGSLFFFRPLIVTFTLQCPKLNVLTLSRVLGYGLLSSLVLQLL